MCWGLRLKTAFPGKAIKKKESVPRYKNGAHFLPFTGVLLFQGIVSHNKNASQNALTRMIRNYIANCFYFCILAVKNWQK